MSPRDAVECPLWHGDPSLSLFQVPPGHDCRAQAPWTTSLLSLPEPQYLAAQLLEGMCSPWEGEAQHQLAMVTRQFGYPAEYSGLLPVRGGTFQIEMSSRTTGSSW